MSEASTFSGRMSIVFRKSHTFDFLPFLETRGIGIIRSRPGCERNANENDR